MARLASCWGQVRYPGWWSLIRTVHSGDGLDGGVVVSVQVGGVAGPSVGVGAGVGGVVQGFDDPVVGERLEEQLAAAGPAVVAGGEGQLLFAECLDDAERRSGGGEGAE